MDATQQRRGVRRGGRQPSDRMLSLPFQGGPTCRVKRLDVRCKSRDARGDQNQPLVGASPFEIKQTPHCVRAIRKTAQAPDSFGRPSQHLPRPQCRDALLDTQHTLVLHDGGAQLRRFAREEDRRLRAGAAARNSWHFSSESVAGSVSLGTFALRSPSVDIGPIPAIENADAFLLEILDHFGSLALAMLGNQLIRALARDGQWVRVIRKGHVLFRAV